VCVFCSGGRNGKYPILFLYEWENVNEYFLSASHYTYVVWTLNHAHTHNPQLIQNEAEVAHGFPVFLTVFLT
jgi:hypothetical protein